MKYNCTKVELDSRGDSNRMGPKTLGFDSKPLSQVCRYQKVLVKASVSAGLHTALYPLMHLYSWQIQVLQSFSIWWNSRFYGIGNFS